MRVRTWVCLGPCQRNEALRGGGYFIASADA